MWREQYGEPLVALQQKKIFRAAVHVYLRSNTHTCRTQGYVTVSTMTYMYEQHVNSSADLWVRMGQEGLRSVTTAPVDPAKLQCLRIKRGQAGCPKYFLRRKTVLYFRCLNQREWQPH